MAFLDADDEYLPQHLELHVSFLKEKSDIDLLWGGLEVVATSSQDLMVPNIETGHGYISVSDCVVQGTLFARRRVFDTCLFSEDRTIWWQDYEFFQRVRQEYRVEEFRQKTYRYYRDSGQSIIDKVKASWA